VTVDAWKINGEENLPDWVQAGFDKKLVKWMDKSKNQLQVATAAGAPLGVMGLVQINKVPLAGMGMTLSTDGDYLILHEKTYEIISARRFKKEFTALKE
jgi:hypothetical protein